MSNNKHIAVFFTLLLCMVSFPAMADNCSGLVDCFNDMRKAIAAAAGLGALTSLALDFLPFIGTGKGLYEAYTGRDMITDEKLEWWQRALGILPLIGPLAHAAKGLGAAGDLIRHADDLAGLGRHADDLGDLTRHADDASDLTRHADDVEDAFKQGWTPDEIKEMPHGSRPDPSEYLNPDYISDHLSKFDDGASYLTPQRALDEWGRDMVGRPDGLYVIPSSEMDDLLKRADGDISVVEKELGIPEGAWQDTDINRIDIENPKDFDLRMPSGNEAAANDFWQPGGHTSEGIPEAVTDRIPAGSYTETPIFKSE